MTSETQDQMLQAALEYWKRELSIIPVSGETKKPLIPWKEYQTRRATDTEVHGWFQQHPDAQIAVVTGAISGKVVVDVEAGGSIEQFPKTATSRSGGGGYHLWYQHPGRPVPNAVKILPLVDIRGDGGYVIVPPSRHPSGNRYEWVIPLDSQPLAPFPSHLFPSHRERVWPKALGDVPEGERRDTLASFAGRILHDLDESLWESVGWLAVCDRAKRWNYPDAHPFTEAEAREVFNGIAQREREKHRSRAVGARVEAVGVTPTFPWPKPMDEAAFYGLAGDFVRLVGPHTEADPVALLAQFHVAFGNMLGRHRWFRVESTKHFPNLFTVLVGETSRARKGTALGHVRSVSERVDEWWAQHRVYPGGLSSGEGLVWHVRDSLEDKQSDPGVIDKRLLVIEEEFSSPLRIMRREGNTLSPLLRCAWDRGDLATLTKHSAMRATGAHVSIIGHITRDELLRFFDSIDAANGFGNRFLWLCVRRARTLPEGGSIQQADLKSIIDCLTEVQRFAHTEREMTRDAEAKEIWCTVYPKLTEDVPGLLGAVLSRAEAQVVRSSLLYALQDLSDVIRAVHLNAALAFWKYAEQSARHIFGDSLGYPEADEILRALRSSPSGLTRTQIQHLFQRNRSADQLHKALGYLSGHQLARCVSEPTEGRSAERWFAV